MNSKLENAPLLQFGELEAALPERALMPAMLRGARGACPNCGEGKLFSRYLAVEANCPACSEDLSHHRADDLPIYLNIFVTGHVVIGAMMLFLDSEFLPMWGLTLLTVMIAVATSVALMRPLKGIVIGAQWAMRMHGFGGHDD